MRKLVRPYIECLQICTYSIPSKTQKVIACKLYGICYEITLIGVLKIFIFLHEEIYLFLFQTLRSPPETKHTEEEEEEGKHTGEPNEGGKERYRRGREGLLETTLDTERRRRGS